MDTLKTIMANLATLAFVVEAVTEVIKKASGVTDDRIITGISIIVGIVMAYATNVSVVQTTGWQSVIYIALAGILASRGGNYLHEVVNAIQSLSGRVSSKKQAQ